MANRDEREIRVRPFRPTLIIGLGGTGTKVLMHVKYLFLRRFGCVPPIVRLLVLDTADERARTSLQLDDGSFVNVDVNEFMSIEWVDTPRIMQRINEPQFDNIRRWLPEKEEMPLYAIKAGAAQVRPLGRLALFWWFPKQDIYGRLRDLIQGTPLSISDARRIEQMGELGFPVERGQGIDVFLVSSLCGGTGSAIFLDIAYLLRDIRNWETYDTFITYLALPGAFGEGQSVQANTYAALKELDYFMGGGNFSYQYSETVSVDSGGRQPFDLCYLLDIAMLEQVRSVASVDQLAEVMAEGIFLEVQDPTVMAESQLRANIQACLGRTLNNGRVTFYSSLGSAAVYIQERQLQEYCTSRLALQLLRRVLPEKLGAEDQIRAESAVLDFIEDQRLVEARLMEAMDRDARGRPMRNQVELPWEWFAHEPDQQLITRIDQAQVGRHGTDMPRFWLQMDANLTQMITSLQTVAKEAVTDMLDNRQPRVAGAFLSGLEMHLRQLKAEINEKLRSQQEEWGLDQGDASPLRRTVRNRKEQLERFLSRFAIIRKLFQRRKRTRLAKQYVASINQLHRAEMELEARSRVVRLLTSLLDVVSAERRRIEEFIVNLDNIAKKFERRQSRALPRRETTVIDVFRKPILSIADFEATYREHIPDLDPIVVSFFQSTMPPFSDWFTLSSLEIEERLESFSRSRFEGLRDLNIEEVILKKEETESYPLAERLDDLRLNAAPWIRYDPIELGVEPHRIEVLGVPDERQTELRDAIADRGLYMISTRDKKQIILYRTLHGFSASALANIRQYRDNYQAVLGGVGKRPLHIDPNYQFVQEPLPGEDTGPQLAVFSVGVGLGYIYKRGSWVYLRYPQRTKSDKRLAQGYPRAFERFRKDQDARKLLGELIDEKVKQEGYIQVGEALDIYVEERLQSPIGAYERMMLSRIEEYMRSELGVEVKPKM